MLRYESVGSQTRHWTVGKRVTQVGEERTPARQAGFAAVPAPVPLPVPAGPGARVRVQAGTPMQKLLPPHLVDPYLTGQRSVITGFVQRARDGVAPDPEWFGGPEGGPGAAGLFVLRWRALDIHTYLAATGAGPVAGAPAEPAFALFLAPCPIPVGAEVYRISAAGEELTARYDGQSWLRPGPAEG